MKKKDEETSNEEGSGLVPLKSVKPEPYIEESETETIEERFDFPRLTSQMLDDLALHFGGIDRCSAVCVAVALAYNDMCGDE